MGFPDCARAVWRAKRSARNHPCSHRVVNSSLRRWCPTADNSHTDTSSCCLPLNFCHCPLLAACLMLCFSYPRTFQLPPLSRLPSLTLTLPPSHSTSVPRTAPPQLNHMASCLPSSLSPSLSPSPSLLCHSRRRSRTGSVPSSFSAPSHSKLRDVPPRGLCVHSQVPGTSDPASPCLVAMRELIVGG